MYRSYAGLILDIWPGMVLGRSRSSEAAATEPQVSRPEPAPVPNAASQQSGRPSEEEAPPPIPRGPGLANLQSRGADCH